MAESRKRGRPVELRPGHPKFDRRFAWWQSAWASVSAAKQIREANRAAERFDERREPKNEWDRAAKKAWIDGDGQGPTGRQVFLAYYAMRPRIGALKAWLAMKGQFYDLIAPQLKKVGRARTIQRLSRKLGLSRRGGHALDR
jgi:hypothetical protein